MTISTVHKAKGLEWPVVIVTGLDEPVVRALRRDRPRLDAELGVMLPLEITVVDDHATERRIDGDSSAVWDRHRRTTLQREYAEAKRILYVACTRARDRLILAGALQEGPHPRTLDPALEFMHCDGVERWLRFLHPEIARSDRRRLVLSYAAPPHRGGREATGDTLLVRRR